MNCNQASTMPPKTRNPRRVSSRIRGTGATLSAEGNAKRKATQQQSSDAASLGSTSNYSPSKNSINSRDHILDDENSITPKTSHKAPKRKTPAKKRAPSKNKITKMIAEYKEREYKVMEARRRKLRGPRMIPPINET